MRRCFDPIYCRCCGVYVYSTYMHICIYIYTQYIHIYIYIHRCTCGDALILFVVGAVGFVGLKAL